MDLRISCLAFVLANVHLATHAQVPAVQAVQQPVTRRLSLGTSVSVPDGGRVNLGGVGRSATGRNSAGPFRSGTSRGYETSGSSQSVSVHIRDFESMDQALLEEAEQNLRANQPAHKSGSRSDRRSPNPRVEHAWQSMQTRQRSKR